MNSPLERPDGRKSHRRVFLRHVLSGGGTLMFLNGKASGDTFVETSCKASVADSLLLYLDFLGDVEDYAVREGFKIVRGETQSLLRKLDELTRLVDKLKGQLADSPKTTNVKEMRDLAEMGRSSIRLIRTSVGISDEKANSLLSTMAVASRHVAQKAEDLLPKGKGKSLSPDAAATLREIIELVDSTKVLQSRVQQAQTDYSRKLDSLAKLKLSLREKLLEASFNIVSADNSKSPSVAKRLRNSAIDNIEEVILELEDVQKRLDQTSEKQVQQKKEVTDTANRAGAEERSSEEGVELSPAVFLVRLLRGAQELIRHPEKIKATGTNGAEQRWGIIRVSNSSGSMEDEIRNSLAGLVDVHCPPASPLRIGTLTVALMCIWALYWTREERVPLIKGVLRKYSCPDGRSVRQLAKALANFSL